MSNVLAFSVSQFLPSWRQWLDQMWAGGEGVGLLLLLGGVAFVFFGHSIYRVLCTVAFAVLGWWLVFTACQSLGFGSIIELVVPLLGGLLLGAAGFYLAKYGVALLGGVAAAGICWQLFGGLGVPETIVLILCVISFVGVAALAIVRHDGVIVFASTVFGAVMIVSGAVALFARFPSIGANFRQLLARYPAMLWMSFITPLVIGLAFQLATLKNKGKATLQ